MPAGLPEVAIPKVEFQCLSEFPSSWVMIAQHYDAKNLIQTTGRPSENK